MHILLSQDLLSYRTFATLLRLLLRLERSHAPDSSLYLPHQLHSNPQLLNLSHRAAYALSLTVSFGLLRAGYFVAAAGVLQTPFP
jgi:hypothetical protein